MDTMEAIVEGVREVRDELLRIGEVETAQKFSKSLKSFWTTGSEFLVALLDLFESTQSVWRGRFDETHLMRTEEIVASARELLGFS